MVKIAFAVQLFVKQIANACIHVQVFGEFVFAHQAKYRIRATFIGLIFSGFIAFERVFAWFLATIECACGPDHGFFIDLPIQPRVDGVFRDDGQIIACFLVFTFYHVSEIVAPFQIGGDVPSKAAF